jgi:hypothetical protein
VFYRGADGHIAINSDAKASFRSAFARRIWRTLGFKGGVSKFLGRLCTLLAAALLVGCPSTTHVSSSGFPGEITGVGDSRNFPLRAAEYQRGKMLMYQPGMRNYSIAYDRYDATLQNAVTLYFYPLARPIVEQFTAEKQEILRAHPGSMLIAERQASFRKNGLSFQAFIATFEFEEIFARQRQKVFSELVLIALPDRFFKVRSSAPIDKASPAEASMFELLGKINWAY